MSKGTRRDALFDLGGKMRDNGIRMVMQSELKITEHGSADPRMLAVALLGRSLSNYKGAALMIREGLIVEARTLVRSCYENMFFIAKLDSDGSAFVSRMRDDEIASKLKRSKFVLETPKLVDGLLDEVRDNLRNYSNKIKAQFPQAKPLNPKVVAEGGLLASAYLAYSQLSADAAHPSFSSLVRHFTTITENDETIRCFDIQPVPSDADLDETLSFGVSALLGSLVGTNQVLGGTPVGKELWSLSDEFIAISGIKRSAA
jgi:hypothetical protein